MDYITKHIFDKIKKENPKLSRQEIRKAMRKVLTLQARKAIFEKAQEAFNDRKPME